MRIAVCMYGKIGGMAGQDGAGESVDAKDCFDSFKKHIIDKNDKIDFFLHSWDVESNMLLRGLYNPIGAIIEEQIVFAKDKLEHQFKSRWYSTKISIELKSKYEWMNGFKYDCVMVNRYDCIFHSDLIFNETDMRYFWASVSPNRTENDVVESDGLHMQDFWFFSNSAAIDHLGKVYDECEFGNCHRIAYAHMKKKYEIKHTLMSARDFDLYRWYKGTDTNYPRKWYRGIR